MNGVKSILIETDAVCDAAVTGTLKYSNQPGLSGAIGVLIMMNHE